jgi:hypothetical protein
MEPFKQYERVGLVTDRYESEGAGRGMIGFIIDIYNGEAFEVEFCRSDGVTVAQIVATESELERHPEP